jgi:hypothetical protein
VPRIVNTKLPTITNLDLPKTLFITYPLPFFVSVLGNIARCRLKAASIVTAALCTIDHSSSVRSFSRQTTMDAARSRSKTIHGRRRLSGTHARRNVTSHTLICILRIGAFVKHSTCVTLLPRTYVGQGCRYAETVADASELDRASRLNRPVAIRGPFADSATGRRLPGHHPVWLRARQRPSGPDQPVLRG